MVPPTEMTFGSVAGEPIVLVEPASPLDDADRDARGDRRVVELLGHVQRGDVGERVAAERLVDAR